MVLDQRSIEVGTTKKTTNEDNKDKETSQTDLSGQKD